MPQIPVSVEQAIALSWLREALDHECPGFGCDHGPLDPLIDEIASRFPGFSALSALVRYDMHREKAPKDCCQRCGGHGKTIKIGTDECRTCGGDGKARCACGYKRDICAELCGESPQAANLHGCDHEPKEVWAV